MLITFSILLALSTVACWSESSGDYRVKATFPSPSDGHYATLWEGMGGGAAGWCYQRISVNRNYNKFDLEKEKEISGYIFSVSCSSKVTTTWTSETDLHISYSMGKNGVSVYQKPTSEYDSDVQVTYAVQTQLATP